MTRTRWLLAAVVSLVLPAPNLALAQGAALESFHPGCNSMSRSRDPDCVATIHRFCTGRGGAGISQEVGGAVFGVACFAPSWYGDVPLSQLTQQHPGCRQLSQ